MALYDSIDESVLWFVESVHAKPRFGGRAEGEIRCKVTTNDDGLGYRLCICNTRSE